MASKSPPDDQPPRVLAADPQVLLLAGALAAGGLLVWQGYRRYLRPIRTYLDLSTNCLDGQRRLVGHVTRVGDGDNFRFFHTPGGRILGWGWLRPIPTTRAGLKDQTLQIRLCGVDAPERAHFGKPAQPFSDDALYWLQSYIHRRTVTITPYSIDQYKRVVARAQVWKLTGKKDVSAEMIRNGLGVVYEAKFGAEFGDNEAWYRKLEQQAKRRKRGLWKLGKRLVTPGEFKKQG